MKIVLSTWKPERAVVEISPARDVGERDREVLTALLQPPGTEGRVVSKSDATTDTGWPVKLVFVRVAKAGELQEVRLVGLYRVYDEEAAVVVSWPAPGASPEDITEATRELLAARPSFADELPALADLFQ